LKQWIANAASPEDTMTLRHCFKVRRLILTAALIAGLSLAAHATAQERPFLVDLKSRTTTDLGTLGGNRTVASGINDAGQVTGYSITSEFDWHAFITGPDGVGMRDLGTLGGGFSQAYGINNAGQVVGQSDKVRGSPLSQPFITGPDGVGMRELGALGGIYDRPTGINDAGQVGGWFYPASSGNPHAFITGPNGMGVRDLGDLGTGGYLQVSGINDAGQLVGDVRGTVEGDYGFITGPDGMGVRNLGSLGGGYSRALSVNNTGQVVGYSNNAESQGHAFVTGPDGMGMRDLGDLGGGLSFATGINDAGQVVGYSATSNRVGVLEDQHAFVTGPDGNGMMDLNSLVDLPAGWILTNAMGINNNGQVIAAGIVPEPETYALMLCGLVLVGFIGWRNKSDIRACL
jgi:probable HAF family extracellular repeat protein